MKKNPLLSTCMPFMQWRHRVNRQNLLQDLLAALTGAVIVLPQGVAYAFIAGLPPEYGLYTAIVSVIVAALFGSSWHLISGPTAAISIVIMSVASSTGAQTLPEYISAVITITFLAGIFQLLLAVFRMGGLVNFISHTVIIGFTAGAAILIASSQMEHLLGLNIPTGLSFIEGWAAVFQQLAETNLYSLAIGLTTLFSAVLLKQINRRIPYLLTSLVLGSLLAWILNAGEHGVALVGALPGTLPPLSLPDFSPSTLQTLVYGALAVAILGLIEAVSIARSISLKSHQLINGNQEFFGQGLSNVIGSFFSCYASSGSFTRSGANYDSGAQTPLAGVFSGIFLAVILISIPDITAYLPLPAMAGSILFIAWNLLDREHIREIIASNRSETAVLLVTFSSTLLIELEFAIYVGVLLSLALYLRRTSRPVLMSVAPIPDHPRRQIKSIRRFHLQECPQFKLLRIDDSIFFGATDYIQQRIRETCNEETGIRHLLIVGKGINFIDVAGAEMLFREARRIEQLGGKLMLCSLKGTVIDELYDIGFYDKIGAHLFYDSPQDAIREIVPALDLDICANCTARIFNECPPVCSDKKVIATDS